jgi:hypothetical protein
MKLNDSQVHSHIVSYTCVGVVNVQSLGWKREIGPLGHIRMVLKHGCLMCLCIIHLDLICMNYDQKKGWESNWEFDFRLQIT